MRCRSLALLPTAPLPGAELYASHSTSCRRVRAPHRLGACTGCLVLWALVVPPSSSQKIYSATFYFSVDFPRRLHIMILGALALNSSEAYWMIFHRSGSCRSSEACWMASVIKVAVVRAVSPTVRDSFQLKWKSMGCSSEQPFFLGGHHETTTSRFIYC